MLLFPAVCCRCWRCQRQWRARPPSSPGGSCHSKSWMEKRLSFVVRSLAAQCQTFRGSMMTSLLQRIRTSPCHTTRSLGHAPFSSQRSFHRMLVNTAVLQSTSMGKLSLGPTLRWNVSSMFSLSIIEKKKILCHLQSHNVLCCTCSLFQFEVYFHLIHHFIFLSLIYLISFYTSIFFACTLCIY